MITALLIWLFKKYGRPFLYQNKYFFTRLVMPVKRLSLTILFVALSTMAFGQERTLNYNVLHSGHTVGHMKLQQRKDGGDTFLKVASDVKMKFIFSIQVGSREDAHYSNGKLLSSHVSRM